MSILYFDIAATIILAIILISLISRKMISGRSNHLLVMMLVQILITAISDIWAGAYGSWLPIKASNLWWRQVLCYLYFPLRNLTTPLYQLFIASITDTWHIRSTRRKMLFFIPYSLDCAALISNPFTNWVFYFDENMVYQRGPLMDLLYIVAFLYLIEGVIYLVKYRKMVTFDKFFALMLMYPLNLLAIAIQFVWPQLLVEMFMTSLTMLLIVLVVQRPEEIFNPVLLVRNYISYTMDMKKAFIIQKPTQTIFVKILNYSSISLLLEYDKRMESLKNLASELAAACKAVNLPVDVYYLEVGLFALVTDSASAEKAKDAAQRISAVMAHGRLPGQLQLDMKSCICLVRCPQDIHKYENLLNFGFNFHTYLPGDGRVNEMTAEKDRKMLHLRSELDGILQNAIAQRSFQMYYQPIYSLKEHRFLSAEALIRLNDEKYGFISPELFITAAEKNGMILPIGDFVLDEVCAFLKRCSQENLGIDYIEINLSMNQCMQPNLKEKVHSFLNKYGLRPEQINLEITETAANMAQKTVEKNITALTRDGISFSLDDYGTGYSNLSRTMALPFRIVKLDKSLADQVSDHNTGILLKNTVRMLHEIGMEVVVEGIETEKTLRQFAQMGCDFIQGYYFSKPLPAEDFVEFIRSRRPDAEWGCPKA